MLDYRSYLEAAIARRDYVLTDIEDKINRLWIDGKLTEADRDALLTLAAESASDALQVDVLAQLKQLDARVFALEHPTDIYPVWHSGYQTAQHEIVRYDVTGDGEYDLCRYDGGRASTSLSIGKIEGWHLLDIELNNVATITRDDEGRYIITPIVDEGGE